MREAPLGRVAFGGDAVIPVVVGRGGFPVLRRFQARDFRAAAAVEMTVGHRRSGWKARRWAQLSFRAWRLRLVYGVVE